MKSKEEIKKFREFDQVGIKEELKKVGKELLNLSFRKKVSGIPKSSEIPTLRHRIARLKTAQSELRMAELLMIAESSSQANLNS